MQSSYQDAEFDPPDDLFCGIDYGEFDPPDSIPHIPTPPVVAVVEEEEDAFTTVQLEAKTPLPPPPLLMPSHNERNRAITRAWVRFEVTSMSKLARTAWRWRYELWPTDVTIEFEFMDSKRQAFEVRSCDLVSVYMGAPRWKEGQQIADYLLPLTPSQLYDLYGACVGVYEKSIAARVGFDHGRNLLHRTWFVGATLSWYCKGPCADTGPWLGFELVHQVCYTANRVYAENTPRHLWSLQHLFQNLNKSARHP